MARHLIVGNGVAYAVDAAGRLADGSIAIQKRSETGPTLLGLGDSFIDAPEIRIVQGGYHGENIFTPWFYGKDVIDYSGYDYAAATAHTCTVQTAGTSTAAGEITLKFVRKDGVKPDFFSFTAEIANGEDVDTSSTSIHDAFEALDNIPDWLNPLAADDGVDLITFSGNVKGGPVQSGGTWEEGSVVFDLIVESNTVGTTTATAVSGVADAAPGRGVGYDVVDFEESVRGNTYGYYNRLELPNTPALSAVNTNNYNMYNIVATKDGSSHSQIHGVDNLIEITIALLDGGNANSAAVQADLNGYFTGAFAPLGLV
jgi:hypothetical protein